MTAEADPATGNREVAELSGHRAVVAARVGRLERPGEILSSDRAVAAAGPLAGCLAAMEEETF